MKQKRHVCAPLLHSWHKHENHLVSYIKKFYFEINVKYSSNLTFHGMLNSRTVNPQSWAMAKFPAAKMRTQRLKCWGDDGQHVLCGVYTWSCFLEWGATRINSVQRECCSHSSTSTWWNKTYTNLQNCTHLGARTPHFALLLWEVISRSRALSINWRYIIIYF